MSIQRLNFRTDDNGRGRSMPSLQYPRQHQWDAAHNWALVLAAGEGSRLQTLTTTASGTVIPKQFCSLGNGSSLLHAAIERARVVAPSERICSVVAKYHERWWQALPCAIPARNIIVQPQNRGTANGILLSLLQILHRDPDASLLVLPSDHYVRNEIVLALSLQLAVAQSHPGNDRITLLGLTPESADPDLGYIVPADGNSHGPRDVREFVEKPSTATAASLIGRGGLWNSFIFAAHAQTLLRAFEARSPQIVNEMRRIVTASSVAMAPSPALEAFYERLPAIDFSRDIIEGCASQLEVLEVAPCGWSDLGTPRRVADAIKRSPPMPSARTTAMPHVRGILDLAAQHMQAPISQ
jgi:mannose-1-phosphate guanylyltransferase